MEYYVVEAHTIAELMESVNRYLTEKWTPLGGPIVITTRHDYTGEVKNKYAQAITKPRQVVAPERRESVTIKL